MVMNTPWIHDTSAKYFCGTFSNGGHQFYPYIEYKYTQNTSAMTTTVTATLYFYKNTQAWKPYNAMGDPFVFKVGGKTFTAAVNTWAGTYDLRTATKVAMRTESYTVKHDSAGNASIRIEASGSLSVAPVGAWGFGLTLTLPKITPPAPKKPYSSFTLSASRVELGKNFTITVPGNGSDYVPWGYLILPNGKRADLGELKPGTAKTINLPVETYNQYLTSGEWKTQIEIETWTKAHGGSFVSPSVKQNITFFIPNTSKIQVTALKFEEKASFPDTLKSPRVTNDFVSGVSQIKMTPTLSIPSGLRLMSIRYFVDELGYSETPQNSDNSYFLDLSLTSLRGPKITVTVTVRDNNGVETSATFTANVNAYDPPAIKTFEAFRVKDNSTRGTIKRTTSFTALTVGGKANTQTVKTEYRISGGIWVSAGTESETMTLIGLDKTKSYEVRVTLKDLISPEVIRTTSISTGKTLMSFYKDKGVGIGKIYNDEAGTNVLDIEGNVKMNNSQFSLAGTTKIVGTGASVNVGTIDSATIKSKHIIVPKGNYNIKVGDSIMLNGINGAIQASSINASNVRIRGKEPLLDLQAKIIYDDRNDFAKAANRLKSESESDAIILGNLDYPGQTLGIGITWGMRDGRFAGYISQSKFEFIPYSNIRLGRFHVSLLVYDEQGGTKALAQVTSQRIKFITTNGITKMVGHPSNYDASHTSNDPHYYRGWWAASKVVVYSFTH